MEQDCPSLETPLGDQQGTHFELQNQENDQALNFDDLFVEQASSFPHDHLGMPAKGEVVDFLHTSLQSKASYPNVQTHGQDECIIISDEEDDSVPRKPTPANPTDVFDLFFNGDDVSATPPGTENGSDIHESNTLLPRVYTNPARNVGKQPSSLVHKKQQRKKVICEECGVDLTHLARGWSKARHMASPQCQANQRRAQLLDWEISAGLLNPDIDTSSDHISPQSSSNAGGASYVPPCSASGYYPTPTLLSPLEDVDMMCDITTASFLTTPTLRSIPQNVSTRRVSSVATHVTSNQNVQSTTPGVSMGSGLTINGYIKPTHVQTMPQSMNTGSGSNVTTYTGSGIPTPTLHVQATPSISPMQSCFDRETSRADSNSETPKVPVLHSRDIPFLVSNNETVPNITTYTPETLNSLFEEDDFNALYLAADKIENILTIGPYLEMWSTYGTWHPQTADQWQQFYEKVIRPKWKEDQLRIETNGGLESNQLTITGAFCLLDKLLPRQAETVLLQQGFEPAGNGLRSIVKALPKDRKHIIGVYNCLDEQYLLFHMDIAGKAVDIYKINDNDNDNDAAINAIVELAEEKLTELMHFVTDERQRPVCVTRETFAGLEKPQGEQFPDVGLHMVIILLYLVLGIEERDERGRLQARQGRPSVEHSPREAHVVLPFNALKDCDTWRHILASLLEPGGSGSGGGDSSSQTRSEKWLAHKSFIELNEVYSTACSILDLSRRLIRASGKGVEDARQQADTLAKQQDFLHAAHLSFADRTRETNKLVKAKAGLEKAQGMSAMAERLNEYLYTLLRVIDRRRLHGS
ncbi:hypothetical protein K504DRAFT_507273 [Pleomassaria siparia CBS 279.74]|uniref:Uncharacterized protein n=1 Tax=Pleomassaria siparia CBS 279.74 TaxID=1314801 RepID=A0A6G1JUI4_9PLEO|nr:hypothetical protein K504DRAFT_507273 [Pleomassaria siparia CBS 279.74]